MGLVTTVDEDYKRAFKEQERLSIEVLRLLKTALMNAEIEKRAKVGNREAVLTDEEALAVLKRHIKSLEEAKELFDKGGRQDLASKNEAELDILRRYAPASAGEAEVRATVERVIAQFGKPGPQDFGKVMGASMKALGSAADGAVVSKIVKEQLHC